MLEFIQHNIWMVLIAAISGGMLIWPIVTGGFGKRNALGAFEATQLINRRDAMILDVQETAEYATGHLPNARHIPHAQLKDRLREIEKFKSRPLIVTCRNGNRAAGASSLLRKAGFAEVFELRGGLIAWEQAGLPLTKK